MITDGRHARVDGLTSLAVLPAIIGSWLNMPILDPIFGLLIGIAIVFITRDAIIAMWYRLMDHAESAIRKNSFVSDIDYIRIRWVGHCLHLEGSISVDSECDFNQVHTIKSNLHEELVNELPYLSEVTLSISPS